MGLPRKFFKSEMLGGFQSPEPTSSIPTNNFNLEALVSSIVGTRINISDYDVSRHDGLFVLHDGRNRSGFVVGTAEHTGNDFLARIHKHQKTLEANGYVTRGIYTDGSLKYAGIVYGVIKAKEGAD